MRKLTTLLSLLLICQMVMATRPMRKAFGVKQSDGTTVTVYKQGNGRFGFYSTTDGLALLRNAQGDLCYATTTGSGLAATARLAHNEDSRTVGESTFVRQLGLSAGEAFIHLQALHPCELAAPLSRSVGNGDGLGSLNKPAVTGAVSCIGTPTIPVIMVDFPDRKFMAATTPEKVTRALNEKGYADEEGCQGSVKDYFESQSGGLFVPTFEVVAKVSVSKEYAYYGANSASDIDINTHDLIRDAVAAAQVEGVNFNKYVADGDKVPLVSIFYAGPGEHSSYEAGCDDYLWAHFSHLNNFTVGGTKFGSYFVGNEVLQSYTGTEYNPVVSGEAFDGIGIFVHEFGHALGLPDFYYTGSNMDIYNRLETMNFWSVMDYGQYWFDGYAPVGYNAYERSFLGWLDVTELTEACYAELHAFGAEKGVTAYCIKSDANEKEYFLLENRQPDTWYPKAMGHGMLITHVDYDAGIWNRNTLNNVENRQRFEFVPADGVKDIDEAGFAGMKADLFPGTTEAREFTDDTTPAAKLNAGGYLGKPLYNITETDGLISFCYLDASLTGISSSPTVGKDAPTAIFSADGRRVNAQPSNLPSGLYIFKTASGSRKIMVED